MERFHPGCDPDGVFLEMSRWPNGDWVRYEDYEKLKRENDIWRALFAETFEDSTNLGSECVNLQNQLKEAKRQIEKLEWKCLGQLPFV